MVAGCHPLTRPAIPLSFGSSVLCKEWPVFPDDNSNVYRMWRTWLEVVVKGASSGISVNNVHTISGSGNHDVPGNSTNAKLAFKQTCALTPIKHAIKVTLAPTQGDQKRRVSHAVAMGDFYDAGHGMWT